MQDLYIAIVEDDEEDVQLLTDCFRKYNSIEIRAFPYAQEFLDTSFEGALPCLLVIDLNLPDIRGIDLIDQIKAHPLLSEVPIIVYTTSYSRSEQVSCEELKIRLVKKPDTVLQWEEVALMMAHHCDESYK
jgi:CheY-like chemotaxis protein